jgi:hypothetical protein
MREFFIPGGSYCDASPLGDYVALIPNAHIETSRGIVPLCPAGNLLFLRMTVRGGLYLAGQGHNDGAAWMWNGVWRQVSSTTGGQKVVAFGPAGLYVDVNGRDVAIIDLDTGVEMARVPVSLGSGGIQYVTEAGEIVPGDAVYGPGPGRPFYESTTRGEVVVGSHGWSAGIVRGGPIRTAIHGTGPKGTTFINFQRDGEWCGVAAVQQHGSAFRWFTVSEIVNFPADQAPPIEPPPVEPPVEPIVPTPDPRLVQIVTDYWNASGVAAYTTAHFHEHDEAHWKHLHAQTLYESFSLAYYDKGIKTFGVYPKSSGTRYVPFQDKPNEGYAEDIVQIKDGAGVMFYKDIGIGFGGKTPSVQWGEFSRSSDADQHPGAYLPPPKLTAGQPPVEPPVEPPTGCTCQAELAALEKRIAALEAKPSGGIDGKRIALKSAHGLYVCAEDNGAVIANRPTAGGWETFTVDEQ